MDFAGTDHSRSEDFAPRYHRTPNPSWCWLVGLLAASKQPRAGQSPWGNLRGLTVLDGREMGPGSLPKSGARVGLPPGEK